MHHKHHQKTEYSHVNHLLKRVLKLEIWEYTEKHVWQHAWIQTETLPQFNQCNSMKRTLLPGINVDLSFRWALVSGHYGRLILRAVRGSLDPLARPQSIIWTSRMFCDLSWIAENYGGARECLRNINIAPPHKPGAQISDWYSVWTWQAICMHHSRWPTRLRSLHK